MSTAFNHPTHGHQRRAINLKSPRRITITIPYSTFVHLLRCSDDQGRSLSNLAAYLLERACQQIQAMDDT